MGLCGREETCQKDQLAGNCNNLESAEPGKRKRRVKSKGCQLCRTETQRRRNCFSFALEDVCHSWIHILKESLVTISVWWVCWRWRATEARILVRSTPSAGWMKKTATSGVIVRKNKTRLELLPHNRTSDCPVVFHAFHPSTQADAGWTLWFWGQPDLHIELQISQGYNSDTLSQNKNQKQLKRKVVI